MGEANSKLMFNNNSSINSNFNSYNNSKTSCGVLNSKVYYAFSSYSEEDINKTSFIVEDVKISNSKTNLR